MLLAGVAIAFVVRESLRPTVARATSSPPPALAEPSPEVSPAAAPAGPAGPSPVVAAPAPSAAAPLDEPALMDRLRRLQDTDPEQCVDLARDGNLRFPDSPNAAERASRLIHALVALDRPSEARAEAESMVNDYDDSPWVREIERFTGAHRHRNVRITADGAVELY